MEWVKHGLVYKPSAEYDWNKTHAQVPVVDIVDENKWRIYYATRNAASQSVTSFIEVEAGNPKKIFYKHDKPVLSLGRLGAFDEHGIMPSCIISMGDEKYLYYIGWSQRRSVPYQNSIGLAISKDGGKTFVKYSEGPVIGIDQVDPFFTGTVFVLKEPGIFRAYYLSCIEWKLVDGKPEPVYVLKYATSQDGIIWQRNNVIAIPLKNKNEGGLVSAGVIKEENNYLMWFGYRNYFDFRSNPLNSYRIGFAASRDAVSWNRDDQKSGIDISQTGWDSEMISYPYIVKYKKNLFMFYNGNGFGKSGFGYAVLHRDK